MSNGETDYVDDEVTAMMVMMVITSAVLAPTAAMVAVKARMVTMLTIPVRALSHCEVVDEE